MFGIGEILFAAAGVTQEGFPAGPPTNVSTYSYGEGLVGVQWTNGDAEAGTPVYFFDQASGCPGTFPDDLTLIGTASPGQTALETGQTTACSYYVRHVKNGQFSSWVQALSGVDDCLSCPLP